MEKESQPKSYIDEFEIIASIDSGAYGEVYKAIDKKGKIIAIKKFHQMNASMITIKKEFQIMDKLDHDNLMKVYSLRQNATFKNANGISSQCIVMIIEYIGGGSLFDFITSEPGKFSQKITRTYFGQLLNALNYIHENGYAHRDIKPQNILFTQNYILKLVDFGFVKNFLNQQNQTLKTYLGTQGYMAPQIYKNKYNGVKTDLFAAGVILFMMMSAAEPFHTANPMVRATLYTYLKQNKSQRFWERFQKHLGENLGENFFSSDFKNLFEKLVSADPSQRLSIDQIAEHPWMKGKQLCTHKQILVQFNERKKKILAKQQKQKQKQMEKKKARTKNQQSRGEGQDKKFQNQLIAFYKKAIQIKQIQRLSQEAFSINEELNYAFPALKLYLEELSLPLKQMDQNVISQSSESFVLKELQIQQAKMIVCYECQNYIEDEDDEQQFTETVKFTVQFGKNGQSELVLDIRKLEGSYFYYKKFAEAIKQSFRYCIV